MRTAVTGGCGFIGSHVVDHLVAAGHEVIVVDKQKRWLNPEASYVIADIFDETVLRDALKGCDAVFHLAGVADVNEVAADPVSAVRLDVEGAARVLDAARRRRCGRVLLASTVWVYGATAGTGERTEDAPVDLARSGHLYVSTKLAAEMVMRSYLEMYDQEFTILRLGVPYGPRMREALVIAKFVQAAQDGEPIMIAGTGEQQRNFVYVEDLAEAHVRALTPAAVNQTIALEGDTSVSVNEIAEAVQHQVRQVPIRHTDGRAADYEGVSNSNQRAKDILSWSPSTPLTEGIRRYLAWRSYQRGGR
ncbi:MAG TPA: NAD-dependent epimerase/dehydratase family protein [Streptosporangiaceae bacterium]|nr:NAD-dependent epimerase/dehydratase family protein [Streptosporangiaceae bacterium]